MTDVYATKRAQNVSLSPSLFSGPNSHSFSPNTKSPPSLPPLSPMPRKSPLANITNTHNNKHGDRDKKPVLKNAHILNSSGGKKRKTKKRRKGPTTPVSPCALGPRDDQHHIDDKDTHFRKSSRIAAPVGSEIIDLNTANANANANPNAIVHLIPCSPPPSTPKQQQRKNQDGVLTTPGQSLNELLTSIVLTPEEKQRLIYSNNRKDWGADDPSYEVRSE